MKLYPGGQGVAVGSSYLSLYIALADPTTLPPSSKIYAQIILRMLDQQHVYDRYEKGKVWIPFLLSAIPREK